MIAILMTTGTTIAGLFSLAFGLAGKSLLWGPVAASIVWGLAFSTADAVRDPGAVPVLHAPAAGGSAALRGGAGISSASAACVSRCFTICSRFSISRSISSGSSRNRLISQGSSSRRSSWSQCQQDLRIAGRLVVHTGLEEPQGQGHFFEIAGQLLPGVIPGAGHRVAGPRAALMHECPRPSLCLVA